MPGILSSCTFMSLLEKADDVKKKGGKRQGRKKKDPCLVTSIGICMAESPKYQVTRLFLPIKQYLSRMFMFGRDIGSTSFEDKTAGRRHL